MPTYVVGDIQGCQTEFELLLESFEFDQGKDRLILAGDVVNRGPRSLDSLRAAHRMQDCAVTVLGNHDLHLLATAAGIRPVKSRDTLTPILEAPDRDELLAWLSACPLAHHVAEHDVLVVHAGLPPQWTVEDALARAAELEAVLNSERRDEFLAHMYGNTPDLWSNSLQGVARLRYITNAFTRTRYVDARGRLNLEYAGPPADAPPGLRPWFAMPERASEGRTIVFGHWATLQNEERLDPRHGVIHVDTGCVWGGELTAVRLEDGERFSVASQQPKLW